MAKKSKLEVADRAIDDNWMVQEDANTLVNACKIRKDPERLKSAIDYAKVKVQQYKGIALEAAEEALEGDEEDDE